MQKGIENSPDLLVPAAGGQRGVDIGPDIFCLLFLFGCAVSLLLCRLSLAEASGATVWWRCAGFSCCRAQALDARALVAVVRGA